MVTGPHPAATRREPDPAARPNEPAVRDVTPAETAGAEANTRPEPRAPATPQRISAVGDTFVSSSVAPVPGPPPEPATRRELLLPVSGIDQTAISDSSHSPYASPGPRREDPRQIGRFEVLRRLGAGGMGVVYAAYDWELERRLAIKVVRDDGTTSEASKQRIRREAQAMAKLSHPNVVQVYEAGQFDGQIYVAMEYVKGKNLADWLHAEERTWQEILEVYVQAGRGLAAAHRQGLVHRDFKPENVLVDPDGRARVLDFGLARSEATAELSDSALIGRNGAVSVRDNLTLAGAIMGTPAFMSPEQHLGTLADARSDQFSFCVALYVGLYGTQPFPGETLAELGSSVTTGELRPPPEDTRVPGWVFAALQVGLQTNPDERYPSMDTLLAAVSPELVAGPRRRWVWPAALVAASVLAVVVTLVVVGGEAEATGEDLAEIARLEREAHAAAQGRLWIYPDVSDPNFTAYNRVVVLEHLEGASAAPGADSAQALRQEFAGELVILGDKFFPRRETRPFARDYYQQALVFVPDHPRAFERALLTRGQALDLADRAGNGGFSEEELRAAEPLRILADPDPVSARRDALSLLDPERSSALVNARLAELFRSSGMITDADLQQLLDSADQTLARAAPREPEAAPALLPEPPPTEEPEPALPGPKRRKPEATPPTPPPAEPPVAAVPTEELPERVDPEGSRALSAEGDAARKRGDAAGAEKLYNKALDMWNANTAALIGLSDIAFERGGFDKAVKYAEKAVRAEPGNAEYQIRLGDAYFKVFRYSDAQQRYQKAADLGHPRAAERLARVQDKLGG
ncbi:MAG: protein kinase [Myxococcales bacterium]|nr:protein kinase [Myxococcales bacterium]